MVETNHVSSRFSNFQFIISTKGRKKDRQKERKKEREKEEFTRERRRQKKGKERKKERERCQTTTILFFKVSPLFSFFSFVFFWWEKKEKIHALFSFLPLLNDDFETFLFFRFVVYYVVVEVVVARRERERGCVCVWCSRQSRRRRLCRLLFLSSFERERKKERKRERKRERRRRLSIK